MKASERKLKRATNRGLAAEAWEAAKEEAKAAEEKAKAVADKAKAAARKEAVFAAEAKRLQISLLMLMDGVGLSDAAVVRGDLGKLQ